MLNELTNETRGSVDTATVAAIRPYRKSRFSCCFWEGGHGSMHLRHSDVSGRAATLSALALLAASTVSPGWVLAQDSLVRQVADGRVKRAVLNAGSIAHTLQGISGGTLDAVLPSAELQPNALQQQAETAQAAPAIKMTALGCGSRTSDDNVRVNQDCTFRAQAGALIKVNPSDPQNLIAGFNNRRLGLNHCGFAYSLNGGRSWGDGEPPFWQHLNGPVAGHTIAGGPGTGHTYDAAADPGVAFGFVRSRVL
jgi:hypothetical protein